MENRIRELRNEKGLSQEELAGRINVSQQTISRIEKGETQLPVDILIHLTRLFHVSADYILKLSDVRMTTEYRLEIEESLERNLEFCAAFERLSRKNQKLVGTIMERLADGQADKRS